MRIAIVHSFYRSDSPSGENQVVLDEQEVLTKAGHEVHLLRYDSDGHYDSVWQRAAATPRVALRRGADPSATIEILRPDVVHLHNTFPNLGESWLSRLSAPLLLTIHNYRALCANGLLLREGQHCELCVTRSKWRGLAHGCYRGSRIATAPITIAMARPVMRNPYLVRADRIHIPSREPAVIFSRAGVDTSGWHVFPNGVEDLPFVVRPRHGFVVAGRFSSEKGLCELIGDWPDHALLDVFGKGPLESEIRRLAMGRSNIRLRGWLPEQELRRQLNGYQALILPSISAEVSPRIVAQALCAGTPIVASRANAVGRSIQEISGVAYCGRDQMLGALRSPPAAGEAVRRLFSEQYSWAAWVRHLERAMHGAVRERSRRSGGGPDRT